MIKCIKNTFQLKQWSTQFVLFNFFASHFATGHGKNPETYLTITAIERVFPLKDDLLRKRRESHWINVYDSVKFGANTRD